ncbi:hypothetical protein Taro_026513 [Colocasia esculenta]|uniref:Uncharacterized protein n=1 Tax=Colocasia esculenta TaxID=4460 RepID=A0A843V6B5_COLES|nr:hypothetical protein [Colocasia esculenta]
MPKKNQSVPKRIYRKPEEVHRPTRDGKRVGLVISGPSPLAFVPSPGPWQSHFFFSLLKRLFADRSSTSQSASDSEGIHHGLAVVGHQHHLRRRRCSAAKWSDIRRCIQCYQQYSGEYLRPRILRPRRRQQHRRTQRSRPEEEEVESLVEVPSGKESSQTRRFPQGRRHATTNSQNSGLTCPRQRGGYPACPHSFGVY